MTLKEELEILRGEPIEVFIGDPMDVPCVETSDAEKLCKHPVVSVHMIPYNPEPYIRQAIEGVMMQKTDFEFELVIGEDCSQDRTREICFEYQKKYPDKIRVLWWHENVSKLGGNDLRCRARCRGEYIAYCEGDDYWIDPHKLQKQYELMKRHDAGLCVGRVRKLFPDGGGCTEDVFRCPQKLGAEHLSHCYFHTSTYFVRRSVLEMAARKYARIIRWWDVTRVFCIASLAPAVYLDDITSVRRITKKGIASSLTERGLCILELRQFLPLYREGPGGSLRRHFADVCLKRIHQLFLFKDEESRQYLKGRKWALFRIYASICVREWAVDVYVRALRAGRFLKAVFISNMRFLKRFSEFGMADSSRRF